MKYILSLIFWLSGILLLIGVFIVSLDTWFQNPKLTRMDSVKL